MIQMYRASHSYFMSNDKPTVVLKCLFLKFSERTLFICNALMMMTAVMVTFAKCHSYRFLWPWFSL